MFFACTRGTVFLQLDLASHIFFSQAGLASHRQASPHAGGPHLTQADLTQGGLPSHREAFPHTERPHLTQGGLPSHREGPPSHREFTQANLMQTCFPSEEGLTSNRQTLHRQASSRMSVPKKTNKWAQRGKSKPFGCSKMLKFIMYFHHKKKCIFQSRMDNPTRGPYFAPTHQNKGFFPTQANITQGNLPSYSEASPHTGMPYTGKFFLTQGGWPRAGRLPLTQEGPGRPHSRRPHPNVPNATNKHIPTQAQHGP